MCTVRRKLQDPDLPDDPEAAVVVGDEEMGTREQLMARGPTGPPPPGEPFEDAVPATPGPAGMAELASRGITNRIDPPKGCLMSARDNLRADPPHVHFLRANEGACEGKHLEGLPRRRPRAGSETNLDRERGCWEAIPRSAGKDGCFCMRTGDRAPRKRVTRVVPDHRIVWRQRRPRVR